MKTNNLKLLLIFVVGALVLIFVAYFQHLFWTSIVFHNEPLHSTVEAIGSLASIMMGSLLIQKQTLEGSHKLTWMTVGLIVMGLFDGFHAVAPSGNSFVLLHSAAVFFGGVFFSFMWFSEFSRTFISRNSVIWFAVLGTILLATWTLLSPGTMPRMVYDGEFTFIATFLNVLGGVLFLVSTAFFLNTFYRTSEKEFYWFATFSFLLAMGGIFFMYGDIWTSEWWFWHFLRLAAFVIILAFVAMNFHQSVSSLQVEFRERVKAEAALKKSHEDLEIKVEERTEDLRQANEELSQYAYVVSHDLKAPLRAIRNYSDFLREDLEGVLDGDQKEYFDGINRAVGQGDDLINDLLSLSRIESSEKAIESTDIKAFILELAEALNLPDNVELLLSDDMPVIVIDKVLLRQIFQNLIGNAVKFNTSSIKRVWIGRSDRGGGNVELFVRDNGIGIESRFLDKIFLIFQRLHTRQEYEGAGIGMSIVKKALDKLGGSIRVESEPGRGSTFFVSVPQK